MSITLSSKMIMVIFILLYGLAPLFLVLKIFIAGLQLFEMIDVQIVIPPFEQVRQR
jgi:hypothetical protein